jgi:hypothetical protein
VATEPGSDGLARWLSRPEWLAAHSDDPRVQFGGEEVARSPVSRYALYRTAPSDRALWTSVGLEGDGAVLARKPVNMTLDVAAAAGSGTVAITLQAVGEATKAVRWRVTRRGNTVASGRVRPGQTREARLPVPVCEADRGCAPVTWTLRASGPPTWLPFPPLGAPGPVRPIILSLTAVDLG